MKMIICFEYYNNFLKDGEEKEKKRWLLFYL